MLENLTFWIQNIATGFSEQIPENWIPFVILLIYVIGIAIYAILIWKFYKFLARRNIIELDLRKYNKTEHPTLNKMFASVLFLIEYIIILPLFVFFWFSILSILLLLLSKTQSVDQIVLVSAAIVAATRLTSYLSQDLSKDLAKMFPFTILAVFLLAFVINNSRLIGFVAQSENESQVFPTEFSDTLNLKFAESDTYEWIPKNPGNLTESNFILILSDSKFFEYTSY